MQCLNLAADALHEAIKDYKSKKKSREGGSKKQREDTRQRKKG